MDILFQIIIIISSLLLILLVFVQNPKGGGLSSDFGGTQQLGGVQKTNEFVEKGTWTLAGIIMLLSIILTVRMKPDTKVIEQPQSTEQPANGAPAKPAK
jgi:preprotein translocase subunit SecG